jgi:hypothetical protein
VAEPFDVIGTAEATSFDDFVAASSARLFAAALLLSEQRQAIAEELLAGVLARACRRWGRISRSADPEARVGQMLVDSAGRRQPGARELRRTLGGAIAAAESPPAGLMQAVRRRHRRYQRRLGAGCVLGAAVLALALSLVARGSHESLTRRAAPAHATPGRLVSCVEAWSNHEARTLCARYAGPPVVLRPAKPPQTADGPAPCGASAARRVPSQSAAAAPLQGRGRPHLSMHLCRSLWWR